ncbi:MAG: hypothetical protein DRI98_06560, partial [Bacteroidetes bacterium]
MHFTYLHQSCDACGYFDVLTRLPKYYYIWFSSLSIEFMKRRQFVKGIGLGSAGLVTINGYDTGQTALSGLPDYKYGDIKSLEDVISREGLIVVRVA